MRTCYVVDNPQTGKTNSYRGLRRLLQYRCFPDYDYKAAERSVPKPGKKYKTGLQKPWHGQARGKLVHDQLRLLVNGGGEQSIRAAYGATSGVHPCLRRLIDALKKKKLEPVVCEFIDFYEELGIASAIDLICISKKTGAVSLIELKVGGDNYFMRGNAPLRAPVELTAFNNSPQYQAQLQLAFYRQMMKDHYPALKLGSCCVAQVCTEHVKFYRLPQSFIDAGEQIVTAVGK